MITPAQYAEAWWRGQGRIVPDKATQQEEWVKMYERWVLYEYERWVLYEWHPTLRDKKLQGEIRQWT